MSECMFDSCPPVAGADRISDVGNNDLRSAVLAGVKESGTIDSSLLSGRG